MITAPLRQGWQHLQRVGQSSRPVRWTVAIVVVGGLSVTIALLADAQTGPITRGEVLDGVATSYRDASRLWLPRLVPVAQRTFATLAAIEFAISGLLWGLRRDSLDDIAAKFLIKFTLVAFLLTLITSFDTWVPVIVDGFAVAGERATNTTGLSPSRMVSMGWELATTMLDAISMKNAILNPLSSGFVLVLAVGMLLAFVGIAVQLLRVLVESYVVLTGGILFLGFAGFRATAAYAEGYLNYAVYVGIKIFMLYLIVGTGMEVVPAWAAALKGANWNVGAGDASIFGQVFGGALVFAALALTLPGSIAARITAHQSFGVANALRSL